MSEYFPVVTMMAANGCRPDIAESWGNNYLHVMKRYGIDTRNRIAGFFSNIFIESSYLTRLAENLNYKAERLAQVWPNRYSQGGRPNQLAYQLAGNPEKLANNVYANRMGNGGPETGDGWRYRGQGPIQLTGKNNYIALSLNTGMDCVNHPEMLMTPNGGAISSAYYWWSTACRAYADKNDFDGIRDIINRGKKTVVIGDSHGYREAYPIYTKIQQWIDSHSPEIILP